jgi:hypothetical protein
MPSQNTEVGRKWCPESFPDEFLPVRRDQKPLRIEKRAQLSDLAKSGSPRIRLRLEMLSQLIWTTWT